MELPRRAHVRIEGIGHPDEHTANELVEVRFFPTHEVLPQPQTQRSAPSIEGLEFMAASEAGYSPNIHIVRLRINR